MSTITQPFPVIPGTLADADQMQADIASIIGVVNGNLEMGVNVQAGPSSAVDGDSSSPGSSGFGSHSDHTHIIRGVETLTADPAATKVGRLYYNTVTNQLRMCILTSPATWITIGNLSGTDLPAHATRHAFGGADPLGANSVDQTMLKARTIYQGVPAADVDLSASAWTDIVTGLAVTITGTQVAWLIANLAINNPGAVVPVVTARIIDGGSAVLWQSPACQMSAAGNDNDAIAITAVYPVSLAASPTLKLQVNTSASTGANKVSVKKSQTQNGSVFPVTALQVVVG